MDPRHTHNFVVQIASEGGDSSARVQTRRPRAYKHGVPAADVAHAVTHHLYAGEVSDEDGPPWRVLYLGPDRAANMLEVVVVERDERTELAIHAMKMRTSYQSLLPGDRGRKHG